MKSPLQILIQVTIRFLLLFSISACLCTDLARAQDAAAIRATYGRGVHAYFRGQAMQADRLLTEVVQSGTTDPRVFYFRAMARMRSGRSYEAENDMQIGAALEARNPGLGSTISKSLERVQGTHRRKLEKFRRQARLQRSGEQQQQSIERYEQLRDRESTVLRREVDVPLEQLTGPGQPTPVNKQGSELSSSPAEGAKSPSKVNQQVDEGDPFGTPVPQSAPPAIEGDNPFDTPATPVEEEPTDNIFDVPESSPAEDEDDDPFATDESNPTDPLGNDGNGLESSAELANSGKVKPSKLVGILGRVVGSAMPWQGIELPRMPIPGLGPTSGSQVAQVPAGDDIALGPFEHDTNVVAATATEPDPFADGNASPEQEDPFADTDPFVSAEELDPESESSSSDIGSLEDAEDTEEFDDPFADF